MSQQYPRKFSLLIGNDSGTGLDFSDFHCQFQVRRGDYQNPNSVDVRIFNLSDNTANLIHNEFSQIILQAGYEGSFGLIFRGTIKQLRKGRIDAKTSYVDVTAADGDEAYNFAPCAFTLAANSQPKDSIRGLTGSLVTGSVVQQLTDQSQLPQLPQNGRTRARVHYGMTRDELRELCLSDGLKWSIQDGVITFIPLNGYLPGPVPVLSPDTGLIGVPEQTQNGIEIRTLLNPNIKIGQLIQLDSKAINLLRYGLDNLSQQSAAALKAQVKFNDLAELDSLLAADRPELVANYAVRFNRITAV